MSYLNKGYLEEKDIRVPGDERFQKGPVAVIECVQEIPCNPCSDACPKGAIVIEGSINNVPELQDALCNGCGICVANCPGLAIFIVDMTFSREEALVGMPYEFQPLPETGETVTLMDRKGEPCGKGRVEKVRNTRAQDRTPVVFVAMKKDLAMTARFFRRESHD